MVWCGTLRRWRSQWACRPPSPPRSCSSCPGQCQQPCPWVLTSSELNVLSHASSAVGATAGEVWFPNSGRAGGSQARTFRCLHRPRPQPPWPLRSPPTPRCWPFSAIRFAILFRRPCTTPPCGNWASTGSIWPCRCRPMIWRMVVRALEAIDCRGLNVTLPHKRAVAELAADLSPLARRVGAVNTLVRREGGGWLGTNTDVEGFLAPLRGQRQGLVAGPGGGGPWCWAAAAVPGLWWRPWWSWAGARAAGRAAARCPGGIPGGVRLLGTAAARGGLAGGRHGERGALRQGTG